MELYLLYDERAEVLDDMAEHGPNLFTIQRLNDLTAAINAAEFKMILSARPVLRVVPVPSLRLDSAAREAKAETVIEP